ncbi:Kelch-type beta propeller [Cynara cardunculus var. scolymus]|uniref:Kelch-type beta propeller n=1 Tax=Cynara cardunculus var. scolymus TaxID=59895 RepID=A0A103Y7I2_CYNCS|nr:Kelch-type beta propeller [Cynara cardunculus var. scolymus]
MGSKQWLQPAPTYHPLETYWDTEDDGPGRRCGHTLTAVAQTKSHGPRLILFGGATAIGGGPSSAAPGIRNYPFFVRYLSVVGFSSCKLIDSFSLFNREILGLDGVTNSVHVYDVLTRKWTRIRPAGEPPSPRAAHAAAAVGTMVVFQGGIGPAGHSTDDLYCRVVVRGQGPGPRYGHVMDLVAQRYLVAVSGNDVLSDAWALDTAQKPYSWQRLNPEGDKPSARMYATASARSDGMFLLCGGRDVSGTPLADAYGLLMHRNGQWEWTLAPGVSPSPRYQHAAVFIGARLHVTGGVLRGGRTVDGEAAVAVLDTAAGVWLDRHGMVTSTRNSKGQAEDPSLELMRRCRHAASSIGTRFMNRESMERLAEASAAEAKAANAVWQAAQAQAANPEVTTVSDDSQVAETTSEGSDTEGDIISTLLRPRNWKPPANRRFFLDSYEVGELCYAAEQIFLHEPTVLQLKAPIKVFGDLHGHYIDYLFLGDYVDRGQHSLETITLLLALKGENDGIWAWTRFNQLFNHLPLAALIEKKIICMHGGIGRSIHSVEQIEKIERPITMDAGSLVLMDLSDPTENDSVEGTANNAGALLVVGRGLVVVPKLIHPLPPPLHSPETSPEHVQEDTWMQELNNQRPPTPTRGRPQPNHDRNSLAYI